MQGSTNSNSGRPCDICGDVGYANLISTCSVCHVSREHIYCMRNHLNEVPEIWICEDCQSHHSVVSQKSDVKEFRPKDVPGASKIIGSATGKPATQPFCRNNISKMVQTAKVKFLPTEEVCTLASRAKEKVSSFCGSSGSRTNSFVTGHYKSTAALSVTVASKSFHQKGLTDRSFKHSKSITLGSMHTSSSLQKQDVKPSQQLHSEKSPPQFSCKSSISESSRNKKTEVELGKPLASQTKIRHSAEVFQTPSNRFGSTEHCVKKKSGPGLLGLDKSAASEYVCQENSVEPFVAPNEVGSSSSMLSSTFRQEHPNPPDIQVIWKGSFEIHGAVYPGEVYDGLQANPPGMVSRKAYEFSQQMPGILQFKLQPHYELWPDVFNLNFPTENDIALYFFPSDLDRPNQKYYGLLELIERNDLAMRSYIDGVELLIFTSKQLPVGSQRLNMNFFLWGVFRPEKGRRRSHERATGSNVVVAGRENAVGPSQNVLPKVCSHSPMERTTGPQALVEVERERCDELDTPGFSIPVTSNAADKQPTGKSLLNMPPFPSDLEVPPVCFKPIKLKERDYSSEVIYEKDEALTADANALGSLQKESVSLGSSSKGAFKGSSLQPDKPIKGLESPEVPSKCSQVVSPVPTKNGLEGPSENSEVWDDRVRKGKRKLDESIVCHQQVVSPVPAKNGLEGPTENFVVWDDPERKGKRTRDESTGEISQENEILAVPPGSVNDCLQLFPQKIQTTGFDHALDSENKAVKDGDCPVLSLSRPPYMKDGQRWITGISKELIEQDGCADDLHLRL